MHQLPGGHFCDKCERTVVDFREMTDREIVRLYQQRQGRVCGIFKHHQLDRALPLPQAPREGKPWAAIAALTTALLLGESAEGQTAISPSYSQVVGNQGGKKTATPDFTKNGTTTIEGWVMDETSEPLIGATVQAADGSGTITQLDGSFKLKIGSHLLGTALTVSFMGYEPMEIILGQGLHGNGRFEIRLKTGLTLPEVVVSANNALFYTGITMGVSVERSGELRNIYGIEGDAADKEILTSNEVKITAYPNPFIATLSLEMEVKTAQPYLFHLYNEAGQLVFAESRELEAGPQSFQLDLAQRHLPEGTYFLRISDDAGEVRTKRLVKVSP